MRGREFYGTAPLRCAGLLAVAFIAVFMAGPLNARVYADDEVRSEGERIITLYDRGVEQSFVTSAATIGDALEEADVEVDARDRVEPALDEELVADSYTINVYRARPIMVEDGQLRTVVMSASRIPEQIAKEADITLYQEDIASFERSSNLLIDGAAERLVIERATTFTLTLYGETTTARTQAATVGEMLKDRGIDLGKNDRVSIAVDELIREDMKLRVWREGTQTVTAKEKVAFDVEKIQDADRPIGYRQVRTPGEPGLRTVTYEIRIVNGKEVSRKEIASDVSKQPKKQVEVVGTKNNYSGSLNEWLYALRMCETHGNYQTNTGNGYYGAYQFLPSTWNSIARMTGRADLVGVMPHNASPADQDAMVIANANATAGLSTQHPGCYQKLGLSNKPPR